MPALFSDGDDECSGFTMAASVKMTLLAHCTGCTRLHPHKSSWGQRADVVDYIDYKVHNYFYLTVETTAVSLDSLCSRTLIFETILTIITPNVWNTNSKRDKKL